MKETPLLKLSLIISILGIFSLLLLSNFQQPKLISNSKELKLGDFATTAGKIISINAYGDFSVIKLDNNITITCNCLFQKNQTIKVEGKVTEYKNQLQIQAEKIKKVENVS